MDNQNSTAPIEKMELTRKQDQELKIFFMIGRRPLPVPEERIVAILAYILEDALEKAKHDYPGFGLFYNGQSMTVKELLEKIHSQGTVISPPTHSSVSKELRIEEKKSEPPEKIGFDQFKNGLMLVVDDYLQGEDKETLKRIISGLKYEPIKR